MQLCSTCFAPTVDYPCRICRECRLRRRPLLLRRLQQAGTGGDNCLTDCSLAAIHDRHTLRPTRGDVREGERVHELARSALAPMATKSTSQKPGRTSSQSANVRIAGAPWAACWCKSVPGFVRLRTGGCVRRAAASKRWTVTALRVSRSRRVSASGGEFVVTLHRRNQVGQKGYETLGTNTPRHLL